MKLSDNCFQGEVESINLRKTIENPFLYVIWLMQARFNHRETLNIDYFKIFELEILIQTQEIITVK